MKYLRLKYFIILLIIVVFSFVIARYAYIAGINKGVEKIYFNKVVERLGFISHIYEHRENFNERIELFLLVEDLKFFAKQDNLDPLIDSSHICSYGDIDFVKMLDSVSNKINNTQYIKDNNLTYNFSENDKIIMSKVNAKLKKECKK
jgi:hypothetical protein